MLLLIPASWDTHSPLVLYHCADFDALSCKGSCFGMFLFLLCCYWRYQFSDVLQTCAAFCVDARLLWDATHYALIVWFQIAIGDCSRNRQESELSLCHSTLSSFPLHSRSGPILTSCSCPWPLRLPCLLAQSAFPSSVIAPTGNSRRGFGWQTHWSRGLPTGPHTGPPEYFHYAHNWVTCASLLSSSQYILECIYIISSSNCRKWDRQMWLHACKTRAAQCLLLLS